MTHDPKLSRGYRNRNPGNIDHVPSNRWQGLADPPIEPALPGGRARFARFTSHEYGIRALAVLLITYQDRHGLRSITQIISRWAPSTENATRAYIQHVARLTGFGANDVLDLHTHAHMRPLVEAIITHELGGNPYDARTIDEGLRLAGVPRPVATMAEAARTGTGRAAIQGVTVTAAVAAAVEAVPAIEAVGKLPQWVGLAVILAVAAVTVAALLARRVRQ